MNKKKIRSFFELPESVDRKKLIELGKTVLILCLAASAVLLSGRAGLFQGSKGEDAATGGLTELIYDAASGYTSVAAPFCVVVTPEAASHYAVMYDGQELTDIYARFSPVLGEALGSSGAPVNISEDEWRTALRSCGVYFDFYNSQSLSVLAGWLGTGMTGGASNHTSRSICLTEEEGRVSLYYIRARDGLAYRCSTALGSGAVSERTVEYLPNGALYNFEQEQPFELVKDDAVLLPEQPQIDMMTALPPTLGETDNSVLIEALGMNSYLATPYTEADGTRVFVEGDATLRMDTSGIVSFTTDTEPSGSTMSAARTIEFVRELLDDTIGRFSGAASLCLTSIELDTEGREYTVVFDYRIGGLPVALGGGHHAATVLVSGSTVTGAELVYRQYAAVDGVDRPLPPIMAAALVQSSGGGEPRLCYSDDFETVTAQWTVN